MTSQHSDTRQAAWQAYEAAQEACDTAWQAYEAAQEACDTAWQVPDESS